MTISRVPPLHYNVPIVDPNTGAPTPALMTIFQILLDEKGVTDALADSALQPGTITTSGLTEAAQTLLGNKEGATGAIEELTLSQALDLIGAAAQGDILFRGASGWERLPAGTAGQVLSTGGTGADPSWATASGGGGGAMSLISEVVTSASQASVTFSSTPATYRDLIVVVRGRGDTSALTTSVKFQFNADTATNYQYETFRYGGSSLSAGQSIAQTSIIVSDVFPAATAMTSAPGHIETRIYDYKGTTFLKQTQTQQGASLGTTTNLNQVGLVSGQWNSTTAINAIKVFLSAGNFVDGSVVSLYGNA